MCAQYGDDGNQRVWTGSGEAAYHAAGAAHVVIECRAKGPCRQQRGSASGEEQAGKECPGYRVRWVR